MKKLFFSEFDPKVAALFRKAMGLLYLIIFIFLIPNWNRFFSSDGILSLKDLGYGRYEDVWNLFYLLDSKVGLWFIWSLGFLASSILILGKWTRLAFMVLFVVQASMIHRNPEVCNGEDLVLRMLLFYSCFADFESRTKVPNWPFRMMQIHMVCIYVFSLPHKLISDVAWINGELMYYALNNWTWSRWPWPELTFNPVVPKVMTYTALLVEGLVPVLIWFKRFRIPATLTAMAFHLSIGLIMNNLTFFSLSMVVGFIVFFPKSIWNGRILQNLNRSNLILKKSSLNH